MAKKKPNKHGLSRYIPQEVRQTIRKNSGFGCVICGSMFCDYEHIEPEFHDATEHNPEHMTLLCGGCHHHVTGKRKSKRRVWKAREEPFALKHGYIKDIIEPSIASEIRIGSSFVSSTEIVVEIHGKPILWFEKPSEPDEPMLVNAIFNDDAGKPLAYINRNQFTATVGEGDIKSESTSIEFRPRPRKVSLSLNITADEPLCIDRLDMGYQGMGIKVLPDRSMYITSGESNIKLSEVNIENCGSGFGLGSVPSTRNVPLGTIKKLDIAYAIARHTSNFVNICGSKLGWLTGNLVVNRNYDFVAKVNQTDSSTYTVENLFGEFIGYLYQDQNFSFSVEMPQPEYDDYEPIWQSPISYKSKFIRSRHSYDLTHRFFGRYTN
ncbi:HNH endonuclease [Vibrio cyclitrophicus]|uniref:HNH endonuclease n=1 Tax=Vibrio cyclitrophicus TaxID=47951 RepID=UPI00080DC2A1|nr:hypothetical protein [Vibrio cyclitrophicus]OCH46119.1 hypothetical protein A6E07_15795 [Vibrio cyclitrophicus]